jgi:precorrin-3B synthase
LSFAVGVAAPFGRLEATQLQQLVSLADEAGAADLRLSPWRSVYFGVRSESLLEGARSIGLIVDDRDPLLRIEACPGAPDCRSSTVETRRDARLLAVLAEAGGFLGTIHVSGCTKKCACSAVTDLTLVGEEGRYCSGSYIIEPCDFPVLLEQAHG